MMNVVQESNGGQRSLMHMVNKDWFSPRDKLLWHKLLEFMVILKVEKEDQHTIKTVAIKLCMFVYIANTMAWSTIHRDVCLGGGYNFNTQGVYTQ